MFCGGGLMGSIVERSSRSPRTPTAQIAQWAFEENVPNGEYLVIVTPRVRMVNNVVRDV